MIQKQNKSRQFSTKIIAPDMNPLTLEMYCELHLLLL
jgi:hypothetical protein